MHRSGTSLLARLCHEAGGDLGDPASFYPGDKWNPRGYYEQRAIQDVNIALVNGAWGRLSYFRLPRSSTIIRRAAKFTGTIKALDREYRGKIVKENRFCITLPAWLEYGATLEGLLICLRHPYGVAKSLRRRNKIPLRLGYSLWAEHYRRLDRYTAGTDSWYVLYEDLVDGERGPPELAGALGFLGIDIAPERLRQIHGANVDLTRTGEKRPPVSMPDATVALWEDLLDRHREQSDRAHKSQAAHA